MSIQHIGNTQLPVSLIASSTRFDRQASKTSAEAKGPLLQGNPGSQTDVVRRADEYNQRMSSSHRAMKTAGTLRRVDQAMEAVGKTVERMESDLEVITKSYPPFPPGSEERVKRLRSYTALRAMIDRLTVPPKQEEQTRTAGIKKESPAVTSDEWTFTISSNGLTRTVRQEDIQKGPTGLNIPELVPPETVDDQSVQNALDALSAAKATIKADRERLRSEAAQQFVPQNSTQKEVVTNDAEAVQMSAMAREELAGISAGTVFGRSLQFEQLLR